MFLALPDEGPFRRDPSVSWKFLFKIPGGHKYFLDPQGRVGVADDSGADPDSCDWPSRGFRLLALPVRMGQSASIRVTLSGEDEGYSILESAEGGLEAADRFGLVVNFFGKNARLRLAN